MRDLRAVGQNEVDARAPRLRHALFELLRGLLLAHAAVVDLAEHHVGVNALPRRHPCAKAQIGRRQHGGDNGDDLARLP